MKWRSNGYISTLVMGRENAVAWVKENCYEENTSSWSYGVKQQSVPEAQSSHDRITPIGWPWTNLSPQARHMLAIGATVHGGWVCRYSASQSIRFDSSVGA
jgi:hypothetical protein